MASTHSEDAARARREKFASRIQDNFTSVGGGKMAIDARELQSAVADDLESAAEMVNALCRQPELPGPLGQMAMAIAGAYHAALGDDSLMIEVANAPWFQRVNIPHVVEKGAEHQPPPDIITERLGDPDDDSLRILQVEPEDLRVGSIEAILKMFDFANAGAERTRRLEALWGKCVLTFPLDDDPRYIVEIPEVRSYIAKIQAALPYFPVYLNYHQAAGMFYAYFGALADLEMVTAQPGGIDLMHPSLVEHVVDSMLAIGGLARSLNKDPRPAWRQMLAVYPEAIVEGLVGKTYEKLFGKE